MILPLSLAGSGRSRLRARSHLPVAQVSVAGASPSIASSPASRIAVLELIEVRADQLAAGRVAPAHRRPGRAVGMRAVDEQLVPAPARAPRARARARARRRRRRRGLRAARCPAPTRSRGRAPAVVSCERERRRGQRPVDALRESQAGGAPHPGIDAVRRGGVPPADADEAGECGRGDLSGTDAVMRGTFLLESFAPVGTAYEPPLHRVKRYKLERFRATANQRASRGEPMSGR